MFVYKINIDCDDTVSVHFYYITHGEYVIITF